MADVNVLVLRAAGINCDEEIMHAWQLAGAHPALVHINRLAAEPAMLSDVQIVTIPGGFSYGDDAGAGVILGQRLALDLADALGEFVDHGGGVLGVCNGFQALVKAGLLPGGPRSREMVTVTYNQSGRFEARWVRLRVATARCPFLREGEILELPVEHGEGRVVTADAAAADALFSGGHVAVQYIDSTTGGTETYPANPNGSVRGIAGLCDSTGRIMGLMPHPDRYLDPTQHPLWTRKGAAEITDGLRVFRNGVAYWS